MDNTKQKTVVYNAVHSSYDHPTADVVYARCKEVMKSIGLATVYRNLDLLSKENKIKRIRLSGGDRFDSTVKRHAHFTCNKCGNFVDVQGLRLEDVFKTDYDGIYEISNVDVVFSGICTKCKADKK